MTALNKISKLVENQFPDFYKEEGPKFLAFIEAYYEYLEQENRLTDRIQNLQSYSDINTTTDEFIDYYLKTFLPTVPVEVTGDKKIMTKYVKFFNQSRGTLSAYKLLFRSIFNEDIDVEYPSQSILKVSDGDWRQNRYLNAPFDSANYRFIGKTIVGQQSRAEALVETVIRKVVNGRDLQQIILSNIRGSFQDGERIFEKDKEADHSTLIEGGIKNITIVDQGSRYVPGDVVKLISDNRGDYGKGVVATTVDLGGVVEFNILDGGSGFSATGPGGSIVTVETTDAESPASFTLLQNSLENLYALVVKTPLIGSNTLFGSLAPTIGSTQLSQFNDMLLSSPNFGFPEDGEEVTTGIDFRTNTDAMINIANTYEFSVGDKLYGATSSANAIVTEIFDATDGDCWLKVDTYKNFSTSETINRTIPAGTAVGTVSAFQSNTIGQFALNIGLESGQTIALGDEVVGVDSEAFGVVKRILGVEAGQYEHIDGGSSTFRDLYKLKVAANTTANLTAQFDGGPMRPFNDEEGIRIVGSSTIIANVASFTTNTAVENIYTRIGDALQSEEKLFGTIAVLAEKVSGAGYTIQPDVSVVEPEIAALGIGEQYLTIQYDDVNFGTSNSQISVLDTNDRIVGQTSGASGDVKGGSGVNAEISRSQYANGTYESIIRVWQDYLQRSPGNIYFANNEIIEIYHHESSHIPGNPDNREEVGIGSAQIVNINDRGILGRNANITTSVGANGAITTMRILDSGFAYVDGETVTIESNGRVNSSQATGVLSVDGVANSEGFYATTRGHVSSLRGYLHDGEFYQEYSYQTISAITLDKYKDIALSLVHPAGQALFGKFRTQSTTQLDVATTTLNTKRIKASGTVSISKTPASGTIAITNGSKTVVGTSTDFANELGTDKVDLIIEIDPGNGIQNQFVPVEFVATSATSGSILQNWIFDTQSSANVYYANSWVVTGSSTNFDGDFSNGATMLVETNYTDRVYQKITLNTVESDTLANTKSVWLLPDISSANVYYISES